MKLKDQYFKKIIPGLKEKFGYKNERSVPRIVKVCIGVGLNKSKTDNDHQLIETATDTIRRITGQHPVQNLARKSIAGFKIREGMVVGLTTTLRGNRMYDFLEKLLKIGLPRTRDFRGISLKNVDQQGNITLGFKEQIIFPEISTDEVDKLHGIKIVVVTNAKNRQKGIELLKLIGFPFKENSK